MTIQLHQTYLREQIPAFFGDVFNRGKWLAGHMTAPTESPKHIILLVTLEKKGMKEEHLYKDRFISADAFNWQSQNATSKESKRGQQLINHRDMNLGVHLFVRKTKKVKGKAAPFTYCGELDFVSARGNKPISAKWSLINPLPTELYKEFK